jgi:hypothetical protein
MQKLLKQELNINTGTHTPASNGGSCPATLSQQCSKSCSVDCRGSWSPCISCSEVVSHSCRGKLKKYTLTVQLKDVHNQLVIVL